MKISYKKLWVMLAEKEMSKVDFREALELSTGMMTKLNKGEEVSLSTLLRICELFKCNIGDVCDVVEIECKTRQRKASSKFGDYQECIVLKKHEDNRNAILKIF